MAQSDISPRRPEFNPRPIYVTFLVHKVALEQVLFIEYFGFSIPPVLHAHFYLHVALTKRTNRGSLTTVQKYCCFENQGALGRKVVFFFIRETLMETRN